MGRRRQRRRRRKTKPYVQVGRWVYLPDKGRWIRVGLFCPECGKPLYYRTGIHGRLVCFECGWEETRIVRAVDEINEYDIARLRR